MPLAFAVAVPLPSPASALPSACCPQRPIRASLASRLVSTGATFDSLVASRRLALCFVGMSNCGKSHWSGALADGLGFSLCSVDEEIERAIAPELTRLGFAGIDGMAEWMGFPSDDRFERNQARYLELEEEITSGAVEALPEESHGRGNFVLDTTGSVVYLSKPTQALLRERYLVVHLEASDDMLGEMTDKYFEVPKPVVWGDCFDMCDGEEAEAALRRCYPRLLRQRRMRYADLAHISIPASLALSRELQLSAFLDILRDELGKPSMR